MLVLQAAYKMLDNRLLERATHRTQNLHTAEWNMNTIRKSLSLLDHRAITYVTQSGNSYHIQPVVVGEHVMLPLHSTHCAGILVVNVHQSTPIFVDMIIIQYLEYFTLT